MALINSRLFSIQLKTQYRKGLSQHLSAIPSSLKDHISFSIDIMFTTNNLSFNVVTII